MNKCMFNGRITSDLQLETVGQGQNAFSKLKFSVAVARALPKAKRDANKAAKAQGAVGAQLPNKDTDFINFEATGKTAEAIANNFAKGKPIILGATFQTYETIDKATGAKKYGYNFLVDSFEFTISDNSQQQGQQQGYQQQPNNQNQGYTQPTYQVPANQMPYQAPAQQQAPAAVPSQFML